MENLIKYSKKLSKILRHQPDMIGLALDENGWASVAELIEKFGDVQGQTLTMDILKEVVETNDKKRFAFNDDMTRIRANQGHSVDIDLALQPQIPPALLFHGTASKNLQSIKNQGLLRGSRQHVHLSVDETTAKKVGSRHGAPVILKVKTADMVAANFKFYISENGVWLIDHVPVKYINFP